MTRQDSHQDYGHRGVRRVTIDREVYEELLRQAEAWRDFAAHLGEADQLLALVIEMPGVRDLVLAEYTAHLARQAASETASAISGARREGWDLGPSQELLQQRRQQPGELHRQFAQRHGDEYRGGPVDWATGRPARRADRLVA